MMPPVFQSVEQHFSVRGSGEFTRENPVCPGAGDNPRAVENDLYEVNAPIHHSFMLVCGKDGPTSGRMDERIVMRDLHAWATVFRLQRDLPHSHAGTVFSLDECVACQAQRIRCECDSFAWYKPAPSASDEAMNQ